MNPKISVIIINYGTTELVVNFLKSIQRSKDLGFISEVIIVDNGYPAKGDSRDIINTSLFPFEIKFVQNKESSYSSGVNLGVNVASSKFLIIANSDIELLPNSSIQFLINRLQREPCIGIVGPQLVYPDGTWQRSYGYFPSLREAIISLTMIDSIWHAILVMASRHNWWPIKRAKRVDYIAGAFMVMRRQCFEELGGFNESYTFYGEDADFCWRAWKNGWKVVFSPDARVMHLSGASSTANALEDYTTRLVKAKQKFVEEHYGTRQSRWYRRLVRIVFFERSFLYSFVAKLTGSPNWRRRARYTQMCYDAVKISNNLSV